MTENLIAPSAKLYNCKTFQSDIRDNSSVGDFSKVINSTIGPFVRIDRNNHIDSSKFGDYSYTGRNTVVLHTDIGKFCSISWNVTLGCANHDYKRGTTHPLLYDTTLGFVDEPLYDRYQNKLTIGNDVWIGCGVVVLRGIEIGHGAVIAANSVVTKNVKPYEIVGGVPARHIKYRFEKDTVDKFLNLKWWDWPGEKIRDNIHFLASGFEDKDIDTI